MVNLVSADLSPSQVKEVTDNFMDVDSPTRVLFSSEVLGMGIDLKGLYRVWILGQFGTLKKYVPYQCLVCGLVRLPHTHVIV